VLNKWLEMNIFIALLGDISRHVQKNLLYLLLVLNSNNYVLLVHIR
jgi:hypothetical protein